MGPASVTTSYHISQYVTIGQREEIISTPSAKWGPYFSDVPWPWLWAPFTRCSVYNSRRLDVFHGLDWALIDMHGTLSSVPTRTCLCLGIWIRHVRQNLTVGMCCFTCEWRYYPLILRIDCFHVGQGEPIWKKILFNSLTLSYVIIKKENKKRGNRNGEFDRLER